MSDPHRLFQDRYGFLSEEEEEEESWKTELENYLALFPLSP